MPGTIADWRESIINKRKRKQLEAAQKITPILDLEIKRLQKDMEEEQTFKTYQEIGKPYGVEPNWEQMIKLGTGYSDVFQGLIKEEELKSRFPDIPKIEGETLFDYKSRAEGIKTEERKRDFALQQQATELREAKKEFGKDFTIKHKKAKKELGEKFNFQEFYHKYKTEQEIADIKRSATIDYLAKLGLKIDENPMINEDTLVRYKDLTAKKEEINMAKFDASAKLFEPIEGKEQPLYAWIDRVTHEPTGLFGWGKGVDTPENGWAIWTGEDYQLLTGTEVKKIGLKAKYEEYLQTKENIDEIEAGLEELKAPEVPDGTALPEEEQKILDMLLKQLKGRESAGV